MVATGVREPEDRGLSARHLILVFLVGVAVCGVFFSLGFLVGYNERSSRTTPVTERVTAPPVIPPTVNPLAQAAPSAGKEPGTSTTTANAPAESQLPTPATPAAPAVSGAKAEKQPEPSSAASPAATGGEVDVGFTVQIAASRTKEDAEALVKILKTRGYPVLLVSPEYAHANDNLFRVQVGPFTSREDAEKVRAKLAQEGFKPFIRH